MLVFFLCGLEIFNSKGYVNVIVMSVVTIAWKFFKRKLVEVIVYSDNYQYNQNAFSIEGRITLN